MLCLGSKPKSLQTHTNVQHAIAFKIQNRDVACVYETTFIKQTVIFKIIFYIFTYNLKVNTYLFALLRLKPFLLLYCFCFQRP